MIPKFEKTSFKEAAHTSVFIYKNLHNLPHWHKEHELIYVDFGKAELTINSSIYALSASSCALVKSGDVHSIKADADSIIHILKTDASGIDEILKNKRLCSPILISRHPYKKILRQIKDELKQGKQFSGIIADSITTCLFAEIFRTEDVVKEETLPHTKKYKDLLRWLDENYASVNFNDAAKYMNFSRSYFSKYFQKFSGMSFSQYLNTLKIAAAVEKISSGDMNITEISFSCGFNTIRHFNRVFKDLTGYVPKALPTDYVFYISKDSTGFDPTLNCSEIIE